MICVISAELIGVLAKKGRIEMIRTLKAFPERDFSINEVAKAAGIPTMTAWRAVKDLKKVGMVRTRKIGNATSVAITDDRERLKTLRLVPETDPQRSAALSYAKRLGRNEWVQECRLFGNIGRGEHAPGDDVDVAVIFSDELIQMEQAKEQASEMASQLKQETNVSIVPLCISSKEMARRGGLASELRDKEVILRR
jgi:predicted nucleotidyltransferase/molybdenum-dependent DNA-binding transcriptional regulator ModE